MAGRAVSLNRLSVRNFQSLRKVDLELGTFTVIVGPSSSGKSALMRAFRALAANVRGAGVITRGQSDMAITGYTDAHTVTLERSDKMSSYRLITHADATDVTFTKLNGEVPTQVSEALRLDPSPGSINFAAQFDRPYLLDETGPVIARELGELTNVIQLFEAVRAANKIRASAAAKLKTRRSDLQSVRERLQDFAGLPERLKALQEAERFDDYRTGLLSRMQRLEAATKTLRIAERSLANATPAPVPSAEPLDQALGRYLALKGKLDEVARTQQRYEQARDPALTLAMDAQDLQYALTELLEQAGVCPTCGQNVHREEY